MLNLFLSHFFYRQRSINRRKESLRKAYTWQTSTSRLVYRRKEVTKSNVIFPSHGFPKCMPCSWFLRSAAGYSYLVRLEADLAEENINPFDYMRSSEKKKTVTFFFIPYYPQPHPVLRTFFLFRLLKCRRARLLMTMSKHSPLSRRKNKMSLLTLLSQSHLKTWDFSQSPSVYDTLQEKDSILVYGWIAESAWPLRSVSQLPYLGFNNPDPHPRLFPVISNLYYCQPLLSKFPGLIRKRGRCVDSITIRIVQMAQSFEVSYEDVSR